MPQQKPHVLLLINDEHRPDVLPIEGDSRSARPRWIDLSTKELTFAMRIRLRPSVCRHGRALSLGSIHATVAASTLAIPCLPRSEPFRGI